MGGGGGSCMFIRIAREMMGGWMYGWMNVWMDECMDGEVGYLQATLLDRILFHQYTSYKIPPNFFGL